MELPEGYCIVIYDKWLDRFDCVGKWEQKIDIFETPDKARIFISGISVSKRYKSIIGPLQQVK